MKVVSSRSEVPGSQSVLSTATSRLLVVAAATAS